jgi:hypothetical protein
VSSLANRPLIPAELPSDRDSHIARDTGSSANRDLRWTETAN